MNHLFAVSLSHHTAKHAGMLPRTPQEHDALIHKILLSSAWTQVAAAAVMPVLVAGAAWWAMRRRRQSRPGQNATIDQ